jgi:hypothetical protein
METSPVASQKPSVTIQQPAEVLVSPVTEDSDSPSPTTKQPKRLVVRLEKKVIFKF